MGMVVGLNGTNGLAASQMLCCGKQGHLHTYRFCDNVWTFILENASFKTDNDVLAVDRVKIVACDAKIIARWAAIRGGVGKPDKL